jgi:hypothetical protein
MRRIPSTAFLLSSSVLLGTASPALAQVARVFVSVAGNDTNTCSNISTPCRTFGGGIAQVDPNGEVIVIDSGSYAGATISKPVKIDVASGVVAFSALPIVVNPGGTGLVVLRGLTLKAASDGVGIAVEVQSGRLSLENSVLDGWRIGVRVSAGNSAVVSGCLFRRMLGINEARGVDIDGSGAYAMVTRSEFQGVEHSAVIAWNGGTAHVSDSQFSKNLVGVNAQFGGAQLTAVNCRFFGNDFAIFGSSNGTLRLNRNTVTNNGFGVLTGGASVLTFGNNEIDGNTTNVSGVLTPVAVQ